MKNSRLFQILYLLMERGEMTAGELATRMEVSTRTIYRDLDALSAAGIPVYAQKGSGGGIRLMEQFQMQRSLLSGEDQEQILTALQSLDAVGAADSAAVITQLSGLFGRKVEDWLEVDFESWGSKKTEKEYFGLCRQAILGRHPMEFLYYNSSGEQQRRVMEPYRLCFKGGNWYVLGYCRMRQDNRLFRLNRMADVVVLRDVFEPKPLPGEAGNPQRTEKPQEPKASVEWTDSAGEMMMVEVKFTKAAGYQVLDFFAPEEITMLSDGGFHVRTQFPPGRWVLGFLLSFGAEAEVLDPPSLRSQIAVEAEKIRKNYQI